MMPQTPADTRTPAWPGGGGRGLPEAGYAALSPIAAHGMWPISMVRVRVDHGAHMDWKENK